MIAFDTSVLLDYLDGVDAVAAYIQDHPDGSFVAPSLALFEVYRGAARTGGRDHVDRAVRDLDWLDPLPLTDAAAREAAVIEAELLAEGEPANLGDVLIAGICRQQGARIVTTDHDFERIDGLDVEILENSLDGGE